MEKLGNFFGFLTGLLFLLALLNYFVKWANKRFIPKLPKESLIRTHYPSFMKCVVKNHRFFGFGAAVALLVHLILQVNFQWVSTTGMIALGLMLANVLLGAILFFKLKSKRAALFKTHRFVTVLLILSIAIHVLFKF